MFGLTLLCCGLRLRSKAVHGVAARIFELEAAVRRMVLEGLGVAKYHDALTASMWHLFRMSEYQAPSAAEKTVRFGSHQDSNLLSVVCQHEVEGLETQTRDGQWVLVRPSPTSLVVMVGNALRVRIAALPLDVLTHCWNLLALWFGKVKLNYRTCVNSRDKSNELQNGYYIITKTNYE